MSYVADSLVEGESILYQTTVSYWAYATNIYLMLGFMGAAWFVYENGYPIKLAIAMAMAGTAIAMLLKVLRDANELAATNLRVIIKVGWLWQRSAMVYLSKIEGVEVDQSLQGRLLGYGTIQVRGVGAEVFPVDFVRRPKKFRLAVFNAASAQANQACPPTLDVELEPVQAPVPVFWEPNGSELLGSEKPRLEMSSGLGAGEVVTPDTRQPGEDSRRQS